MYRLLLAVTLLQIVIPTSAGIISGRVLSDTGAPLARARVTAVASDAATPDSVVTFSSLAETDEEGRYVLENVPPGKYVIAVGRVNGLAYYPKGPRVDATVIAVTPGANIRGIDFKGASGEVMPARASGGLFAGRVLLSPASTPVAKRIVLTGESVQKPVEALLTADGSFAFDAVVPGLYTVSLTPALTPPVTQIRVTAFGRNNLVLKEVIGRVQAERGVAAQPFSLNLVGLFDANFRGVSEQTLMAIGEIPDTLRATLFSSWGAADPQALKFDVSPSAREAFRLLLPEGSYALTESAANAATRGFTVKSATYGGVDVLSAPLKIGGSDFPELRLVLAPAR